MVYDWKPFCFSSPNIKSWTSIIWFWGSGKPLMQTRKAHDYTWAFSLFLCIKFLKFTRFQNHKEKRKRFYIQMLVMLFYSIGDEIKWVKNGDKNTNKLKMENGKLRTENWKNIRYLDFNTFSRGKVVGLVFHIVLLFAVRELRTTAKNLPVSAKKLYICNGFSKILPIVWISFQSYNLPKSMG